MGTYKEETLHAKAVKEGIIDQRPLLPKARKPRPVVLEYRWREGARRDPQVSGGRGRLGAGTQQRWRQNRPQTNTTENRGSKVDTNTE